MMKKMVKSPETTRSVPDLSEKTLLQEVRNRERPFSDRVTPQSLRQEVPGQPDADDDA